MEPKSSDLQTVYKIMCQYRTEYEKVATELASILEVIDKEQKSSRIDQYKATASLLGEKFTNLYAKYMSAKNAYDKAYTFVFDISDSVILPTDRIDTAFNEVLNTYHTFSAHLSEFSAVGYEDEKSGYKKQVEDKFNQVTESNKIYLEKIKAHKNACEELDRIQSKLSEIAKPTSDSNFAFAG